MATLPSALVISCTAWAIDFFEIQKVIAVSHLDRLRAAYHLSLVEVFRAHRLRSDADLR